MFFTKERKNNSPKSHETSNPTESHCRHIEIKELNNLLSIDTLDSTISLAISIRFFGILNPINVFYNKDNQKYYVISGYDKLAALCMLGKTKVLCNVITDPLTCDGMIIDEYILKANRNLFCACTALEYLTLNRGYGVNEISSMSGLSATMISRLLKIHNFSPEEKRLLASLEVDESTCLELAKIDNASIRATVLNHIKQQRANIKNVFTKNHPHSAQFAIDNRIITNSVDQLVSKLSLMGIKSELLTSEEDNCIVYAIKVDKGVHNTCQN